MPLRDLVDAPELARALHLSVSQLLDYANSPNQRAFFHARAIRKRNRARRGQFRTVFSPRAEHLRQAHFFVAQLLAEATISPAAHGYLRGRSIRTNAAEHLGARLLLHADIEGFFDSITVEQVRAALTVVGARIEIADLLSRFCTIDKRLRQGTRCAPTIANLVCRGLDEDLRALAHGHECRYTRYADDVTLSGDEVPGTDEIDAIFTRHGFRLRRGRCYVQTRGKSQFVTGLTIGHSDQPRLSRYSKRRMRLILHFMGKYGSRGHFAKVGKPPTYSNESAVRGALAFFRSIEPVLAEKLFAQFVAAIEKDRRT